MTETIDTVKRKLAKVEGELKSEREGHAATKERLKELSLNILSWWKIVFGVEHVGPDIIKADSNGKYPGPVDLANEAAKRLDGLVRQRAASLAATNIPDAESPSE